MVKSFKNAYATATALLYNKMICSFHLVITLLLLAEQVCLMIRRKISIRAADVTWTTALTVPCTTSEKGVQIYGQVN